MNGERGWVARIPAGIRFMAAGAFFFSVMSLLVKLAGRRLPTMEVVLARAVITLVLSWLALVRLGESARGNHRRLLVLRGLLGFAALSCFYYSVIHLPLADATVIQYTNPVFAALIAAAFIGERLRRADLGFILLGLAGVVLVAKPGFLFGGRTPHDPAALAAAVAGAVLSASAYVTVRRLRLSEHHMVIVFYFALVSTLAALPLALPDLVMPRGWEWLLLLGIGVTTQAGQVAITRGLALEPAGRATAVGYLQIVFATLWGVLFFGDVPGALTIAGALLVVAGTAALALRKAGKG